MKLDNDSIWKPGAFSEKRQRMCVTFGPRTLRWKRIVTRLEYVLTGGRDIFVVVNAAGQNPKEPSQHDLANARLAAVIVAHQPRRRLSSKQVSAYLRYPNNTQVLVEVDINATTQLVKDYFAEARSANPNDLIPTPLLSYLIRGSSLTKNS